jgi:DNA-binding transcriptional LysR family regulator
MADRRLQVFHTVARLLSFTKAAESLHMTQPAVTFQVRQLEEYFNTRLFDRTHNRISLTDAGRRVYEYADRILALYGEMENSVRDITGDVGGVLMLGASTTIAEYMLPSLLGEFKARFPEVIIRLQMGNTDGIVTMVENNTIDLGVVEAPVHNKNLAVDMCCTDKMVLIVPPGHPLANETTVPVAQLLDYPFVSREEGSGSREVIVEHLNACGVDPSALNLVMELGSPESIKGAVEAGMGISVLSRATVVKEIKLGSLVAIGIDPPIERPFSFVHQRQKFRLRAIEKFLEFAQEHCRTRSSAV